jgi:hypothetical protein
MLSPRLPSGCGFARIAGPIRCPWRALMRAASLCNMAARAARRSTSLPTARASAADGCRVMTSPRHAELERYRQLERCREHAVSQRQSIEFQLMISDTLWELTKLLLTEEEICEIEDGDPSNMQTPPQRIGSGVALETKQRVIRQRPYSLEPDLVATKMGAAPSELHRFYRPPNPDLRKLKANDMLL